MEPTSSVSEHLELLKRELAGKVRATGDYDSIIWRIRTGYLAVLYGSLGLLVGTHGIPNFRTIAADVVLTAAVLLSLIGFSASGFLIDFVSTRSKLRVVVARDALMRRFVSLIGPCPIDELGRLLKLSGEDPGLLDEFGGPQDRRQTELDEERGGMTEDEVLRRELIVEYQRRRSQSLWVLGSLYVIAPIIGILVLVMASIW